MNKSMKIAAGAAMLLVGVAVCVYAVVQIFASDYGTARWTKPVAMGGAMLGLLGFGLIGNGLGRIKM